VAHEVAVMTVQPDLTELTTIIVASFVSNNSLPPTEVAALIASTHAALLRIDFIGPGDATPQKPAVPVEESIAHDYLVCLNDGQKVRALKRYLQRKYFLTPEQYRLKWGLPDEYPMVAPAYSALRSKIAKERARRTSK
jgi:predicted transcriptional regulator